MRFRPAHQSMINRRHDGRASCLAWYSPKQALERKPRIYAPATWKGGHESGQNRTDDSAGRPSPTQPARGLGPPSTAVRRLVRGTPLETSPSPPFRGEREGPVAQRREGEVGAAHRLVGPPHPTLPPAGGGRG